MAEIVNLRRARKRKQADERARQADRNRVQHGLTRHERELTHARNQKAERDIEAGRIDTGKPDAPDDTEQP